MTRTIHKQILDLSLLTALLGAGCIDDGEPPTDADEAIDEIDEPAEAPSGELIELDDLAAVAPPPGTSVWSETLFNDGTTRQFMLHTTLAGEVVFEEMGEQPHVAELSASIHPTEAALNACADDAYVFEGWHWESKLKWYFHAGSTPGELTADAAESALKAATSNITNSSNSCGLADEVGASHEYLGRKSKSANINTSGNCTSSDSVNMVSFGDLPQGVLATACVWFGGGVAKESDVQLNKQDYTWTTSPGAASCSHRWSVKAVMTHERGHTFGLDHVSEATHGNLTMSPSINGPCQDSESTLGEGDVQGLRALY
jgi:hypothetical protein